MPPRRSQGNPKRAIGYCRVSTEDQRLGPQAQAESLRRWCAAQGVELVAIVTDHGVSGAAEIDKRPALMEALQLLRDHGAGVLIVAKRDRLARDVMIASAIERLAERSGATVKSADSAGNGTSPEQMLMRGLMDLFAQYERALIRTRTKAAAAQKKARGERWGSVPYGFQLAADGKVLELNEGEQQTIALVQALRVRGKSMRRIVAALNAGDHACRGSRWHLTTVKRIIDRAAVTSG